jgi:predicted transcriptional regulator
MQSITDLAKKLTDLGLSTAEFAGLVGVTPRAVNLWISGERELPGPVMAYLRLFTSLPKAAREQELASLRDEDPKKLEGMYSIAFRGRGGEGLGILVLMGGRIFGSDGAVSYDGSYEPDSKRPGFVEASLRLTVPPGVSLVVNRRPQPAAYWFDLKASIAARSPTSLKIDTPYGPVQVTIEYLRDIPSELAG